MQQWIAISNKTAIPELRTCNHCYTTIINGVDRPNNQKVFFRKLDLVVESRTDIGKLFQIGIVRDRKFCLVTAYLMVGRTSFRLWPLVTDGGIWMKCGDNDIEWVSVTMENRHNKSEIDRLCWRLPMESFARRSLYLNRNNLVFCC